MRTVMKTVLATILLAITALPALAEAMSVAYTPAAFAAAQESGKTIVVDVFAEWCPTCRAQKPIMAEIKKDDAVKDVLFMTVDFDTEKDFLKEHRVAYQSTIIVFKGKQEITRSVAETDRDRLRALVFTAVGNPS